MGEHNKPSIIKPRIVQDIHKRIYYFVFLRKKCQLMSQYCNLGCLKCVDKITVFHRNNMICFIVLYCMFDKRNIEAERRQSERLNMLMYLLNDRSGRVSSNE